jgi:1,6-anhydro-N-acetylmuramate kinase
MQQPARLETASGGTGAPLVPEKALHEAIVVCDYWGMRRIRLSQEVLIGSTALVAGVGGGLAINTTSASGTLPGRLR